MIASSAIHGIKPTEALGLQHEKVPTVTPDQPGGQVSVGRLKLHQDFRSVIKPTRWAGD